MFDYAFSIRRGSRAASRLLLAAALLAAAGCGGGTSTDGGDKNQGVAARPAIDAPTVLLITVDTLRADRIGCYGHERAGTPVIDRLASSGMAFSAAQTTAPLTLPAHASIMTGRTIPAHGVLNNGTYALPEGLPTLAEAASAKGWKTAAFVSAPVVARRYGLDRGFDYYDDHVPRQAAGEQGLVVHYPERAATETVARAISWLSEAGDRPALVWVHLWEPHAPYSPPEPFASQFPDDDYQGEVAASDAAIGSLLDGVRDLGRSRVMTVLTADHGEGLGEHGEPTHGVFLYRAVLRVPLVFHAQGWDLATGWVHDPVSVADIAPTLVELLGFEALAGADGISLVSALTGAGPLPSRAGVSAESHLPRIEYGWSGLRALVGPDFKLIEAPRDELYDVRADHDETTNLAGDKPKVLRRKLAALDDLARQARESAPEAGAAQRSASDEELAQLQALGYVASGQAADEGPVVDRGAPDPKDRVEALALFDEAVAHTRGGRTAAAIETLGKLLEIDPGSPGVLLKLGEAQILGRKLAAAEQTFLRLVEVAPENDLAWFRLGQLRGHRKDFEGEREAYGRALELNPRRMESYKALAGVLTQLGRYREAIDVLERARELDPSDREVSRDLQRLWSRM